MKKYIILTLVAISFSISLLVPVTANASENESLTIELTEHAPDTGSILFDENGQILEVSEDLLLEERATSTDPLSRHQTHFPWGFWTVSTDGFPFVAWGNVRLNSTVHHRTRPYRASAFLMNSNGTVNRSHHANGSAGQTRTASVTGSNSLRRQPMYHIF